MSSAVAERRLRRLAPGHAIGRGRASMRDPVPSGGSRLTLGQQLDSVWEGLHAGGAAECPVCHGPMTKHPAATTATCASCGSRLA